MPLRNNLRKLWGNSRQKTIAEIEIDCEKTESSREVGVQLPLLQVWPSQDSPEKAHSPEQCLFSCDNVSTLLQNDSGIDSVQVSPSRTCCPYTDELLSTPSSKSRRISCSWLHPNHARLIRSIPQSRQGSTEEEGERPNIASGSVSSASSSTSIAGTIPQYAARHSDPWDRRRRSSVMTRYSLFDALDIEYAFLRAATRSSVGQNSLSHSIHKLTFTQSLAFPALAKGLASNRCSRITSSNRQNSSESGLNAIAKLITVIVLLIVSLMVFGIVFKYVKT